MVKIFPILVALVVGGSAAGCASLSLPFGGDKGKSEIVYATQANPVMEIITLWEPGEGRGLDNLPTRGFAGQVLFFTYKHPTPARVDGHVTVYVFDNQGENEEQSRPLFRHTFSSEEWNSLALQTNLGTAYQLFVPYTRKGTHTAHCSLRIKFEPADGGPQVYSKMANVALEGEKKRVQDPPKLSRRRIEPRRFDQADDIAMQQVPGAESVSELRSSSVALPGRGRVSAQSAARLQQFAEEMVRAQQGSSGGVEQAAYFTQPADDDEVDEIDSSPAPRYQLYR
jgi:hypothetical protein